MTARARWQHAAAAWGILGRSLELNATEASCAVQFAATRLCQAGSPDLAETADETRRRLGARGYRGAGIDGPGLRGRGTGNRTPDRGSDDMNRTIQDCETPVFENVHGTLAQRITIPAGTLVELVDGPQGMFWAVADVPLLMRLTGNTHDPKYRYICVPHALVGEALRP